jgi:hypothetical protein
MLQEPGSYVGEVVKVMGKKKVLVKVRFSRRVGDRARANQSRGRDTDEPFERVIFRRTGAP